MECVKCLLRSLKIVKLTISGYHHNLIMAYDEQLQSSWLSSNGELLNLTWNETSIEIKSGPIMEWDDAAWVLSATFIIFNMQTGGYDKF